MIRCLVVFLGTVSVAASAVLTSAANAQNPASSAVPAGTAPAGTAAPAAAGVSSANPAQSALQQQEEELLNQIASLKADDPNYQEQMQSIGAQLRDVQAQMQELMTQNPAFANPNGANLNGAGSALNRPQSGAMPNPASNPGMMNFNSAANMLNPAPFPANGMGSVPFPNRAQNPLQNPLQNMPQNPMAAGAKQNPINSAADPAGEFNPAAQAGLQGGLPGSYDPMTDPILLKQIKDELSFQLKQIQQTKAMLGPQDQALAATLTEQQDELLRQLKDVNEKLGEPADSVAEGAEDALKGNPANAAGLEAADFNASGLDAASLNTGVPSADDYAAKVAKIHQAATLLQEAGLMDLANRALNQAAALGTGNFDGIGMEQDSWFNDTGVKQDDIDDLRASMTLLKEQITTMTASLEEVQTQLKLLSRQMVAAPANSPAAVPAAESAAEPAANPEADAE